MSSGELALAGRVSTDLGFDSAEVRSEGVAPVPPFARLLTGEEPEVLTFCPGLATLRDGVFLLRLLLCADCAGPPPRKRGPVASLLVSPGGARLSL